MDVIVSTILLLFHVLTGTAQSQTWRRKASTHQLLATILTASTAQQQPLQWLRKPDTDGSNLA